MRKSEIFDSFIKIAQEKGLVSQAEHAEHTEKDFHETNPRHDSLSIEQIAKLYGVKPDRPKDMDYKKNIMEDAHPDPVVLSPAHDKLNGLVENENEGQNIRLRIVHKEPDGHLTQRKYAEKQLILSLVRVANDLDNQGQEELRKLADTCLFQASKKKIEKFAFPWLIAGIAAAIGVLYAQQHLPNHINGWNLDYDKAIGEIDQLLNSHTSWGVVGYTYTPEFLQTLNQLKTVLAELDSEVQKALPIINKAEKPQRGPDLIQTAQQPATQEAAQALSALRTAMMNNLPFIRRIISNFGNESFKQRVIVDKGALNTVVDSTSVLHGGAGLIADDFDDVAKALQSLRVDLVNIVKDLKGSQDAQQNAQKELQAAQEEADQAQKTPEQKPSSSTTEEKSPWDDLEKEVGGGSIFGQ